MAAQERVQRAWDVLDTVLDPEVPAPWLRDLGIVRHVIDHGAELEVVLRDLATQPKLRQRQSAAARAGYEAHHTLDRHLDGYEALIARILERKRAEGSRP